MNNKIEKIQRLKEEYKKRIIDTNREADKAFKKGNDILYEYLIGKKYCITYGGSRPRGIDKK